MSTIKEVAVLAGVGTSTVSRVLNNSGYVSQKNREKVQMAIKELSFIPNALGRNLKARKSHLIALFVPTITYTFFSKVTFYIEDELYKHGYKTIIVSSQGKKEKELKMLDIAKNGQVDGLIFITNYNYDDYSFDGLNIVTYDRHIENVPCVTSNNYESTYFALQHLIDKGCKRIVYIGGKSNVDSEVTKRYQAYLDIIDENDMEIFDCYVPTLHGEEYVVAERYLNEHQNIDAIFAQSDVFANCCYQIMTQKFHKHVPKDVKIISFDGIMDEILQHPKFTVVKQNLPTICKDIVDELLKQINGKKNSRLIVVPNEFIIGETT